MKNLIRAFSLRGFRVDVELSPHGAQNGPRWRIYWRPQQPHQMSLDMMDEFDQRLAETKRLLLAELTAKAPKTVAAPVEHTRPSRKIFLGGLTLTVALEALRHADGSRAISLSWKPAPPERLTVEQAEGLATAIAAAKRELLDDHGE